MRAKVLLAPVGKRSAFIAAIDGELCVVDPPTPCHGYANGCVCPDCTERKRIADEPTSKPPRQPWESIVPLESAA